MIHCGKPRVIFFNLYYYATKFKKFIMFLKWVQLDICCLADYIVCYHDVLYDVSNEFMSKYVAQTIGVFKCNISYLKTCM